MKNILVHYEDTALVIASTKNLVSTTYFECTIRKVHIGRWALIYAVDLQYEKFLLGWQGNIVSH